MVRKSGFGVVQYPRALATVSGAVCRRFESCQARSRSFPGESSLLRQMDGSSSVMMAWPRLILTDP